MKDKWLTLLFIIVSMPGFNTAFAQYTVNGINYVDRGQYEYWNNSVRDNLHSKPNTVGGSNWGVNNKYNNTSNNSSTTPRLTEKEKEEMKEERAAEKVRKQEEIDKAWKEHVESVNKAERKNCALHTRTVDNHQYLVNDAGTIALPIDNASVQEISTHKIFETGSASAWLIHKEGRYFLLNPNHNDTTLDLIITPYKTMSFMYSGSGEKIFAARDSSGKMGLLEYTRFGTMAIMQAPFSFDSVNCFGCGTGTIGDDDKAAAEAQKHIPVIVNGKLGVWDPKSERLAVPCRYDSVSVAEYPDDWNSRPKASYANPMIQRYFVKLGDKWGVYSETSYGEDVFHKEVIAPAFEKIAYCYYDVSKPIYDNPSYVGINGNKKTYFNKDFVPFTPEKTGVILYFVLWNGKTIFPPKDLTHNKTKWSSSKAIDEGFSFDHFSN